MKLIMLFKIVINGSNKIYCIRDKIQFKFNDYVKVEDRYKIWYETRDGILINVYVPIMRNDNVRF